MPWEECHVMDERLRFIARLLDGEKMASLCAEFGISRKTGYKIYARYKGCGIDGLTDRSRRPLRHANQLPLGHCQVDVERTGSAADEAMTQTSDSDTRHLTPDLEGTGAQQAMVDGSQEVTAETKQIQHDAMHR